MAERASLFTGTEQVGVERDTSTIPICELELATAKRPLMLVVVVVAVQYLKGRVTAGEHKAITLQDMDHNTSDNMSKVQAAGKGLDWSVGGEHARAVQLGNAELIRSGSVLTAASQVPETTVSEATCYVLDGLPVKASCDEPGPYPAVHLRRPRSCPMHYLFPLLTLSNCCWIFP